MPIVVDPGFAWPPEVDPVVSPDGRLTAIVDPAHAGVLLRADFDDSVPDTPAQPEKVLRRNLVQNPRAVKSGEEWSMGGGASFTTYTITDGATFSQSVVPSVATARAVTITNATSVPNLYIRPAPNATNNGIPVTPGKHLNVGAAIQWSRAATVRIFVQFYKADGSFLSGNAHVDYAVSGGAAKWVATSALIPTGAATAIPYIGMSSTPGIQNGDVWKCGAVLALQEQSERQVEASDYLDGASADSGSKRYRWTGAANASASDEYTPATPFIPGRGATTAKVRFERQDGSVVRSGNPAWAPGGYAHAYDHEATLGGGTLWRAVPIRFDGTEGEPSEYVGAVIPALSDGWAWLKPVTDPDKAMLLKVEPPDLSYDGRVDTTSIAGAPRPAASWDVLEGFTTQLRSLVREKNVEEQLKALLDEGPVLAQFPACAGLPDFYFIRGKLDLEHVHWDGWPWRRYQWDVIQIDRPDTTDSPLRIPGLSYDSVERDWTTYDQLRSTVSSYNKLLEP